MAQVSYGTITITDTNDIEEIFSLYGGSNDANTSPTYSYAAVTGGTTWKRNVTAITNYKYIWQITAITKTGITVDSSNWQQFYGAPIRITGEEGDDARNITAVTPYYYLSTSDSSQTDGSWSTTPQAYPSTGTAYYWTKTVTTYNSGSPSESTAVLDMFLTNAAKDARDANANAAIANSIASHANEDAQGALGIARAMQQNFWWWGEDHTVDSSFTLPAGAYTSDIKVDTFKANPTGGYLVTRSDGIYLNNGRYVLMGLTGNALKFYRPGTTQLLSGTETVDAELTSNGLVLSKGGIESDNSGNGYVYLSTEDKTGITINGHNPETNDPKWRAIIGSKFGVDAEGNLYAAGAHIDGDIIAQSLTIGSGANAYSGIAAINISGYSIEIEVVDIAGSTNTKKLIPHLYHNGMNADSEVTDVTKFLWYIDNNMSVPGAAGLSPDGYIIGEYGHTYKVIYDFGDGVVGSGSAIQTRTVDPQKYITRIDANGITIHPETQNGNSSIRLDGTGLTIYDNNGAYLAKYGSTITLGNSESISNKFNIKITNTTDTEDVWGNRGPGILLRQGKTVLTEMTETGLNIYGDYIDIGDQVTTWTKLASFGAETKIGVNTYTLINSRGVGFYNTLLEDQPFGLINFYYKVKEDYQQSYSHEWEDYSELNDSYDVDCIIDDNLCTVSGNLEFIIDGDPSSTLHTDSFTYNLSKDDAHRTLTYEDTIETEEHNIISYNLVVGVGILSMYGFNPLQCTIGHSASLGENSSLLSYFKINLNINYNTRISGPHYSFGRGCNSIGHYAFAMGNNTIAREDCQLTIGKFNVPTDNALFVIGNGVDDNNRSNLMTISDSNICIGKGVETQYNNQFICGRYNEDYENILFAVGNGFNDSHRHNILSAHDVIGHDTDYITDTIEITTPVQTSYISLSNHPLTIEQILVNGINKTNDFSISTANDTILYPNIQLTIGDIVEVTYTIIQRYQIVNVNDTYIGTLPGQTGSLITITEEHDFDSSWTFTIPNTIYPSSIFYFLTTTRAGGTPVVTEELIQGVAKSIEYYGYTITYNGAYTLSYIYDEDEMHLVTSRRFKGIQYSTEPTILSENGIWVPFGALDDPELYTIIQNFNWLDDVTKDIILT